MPNLLPSVTKESTEVSIYGKGKVSSKCFADNTILLKKTYPELEKGFYEILNKFLDEENFTDERFTHSVHHLIKTYDFPKPKPANILSYDKKIKILTWDDLAEATNDFSPDSRKRYWDNYSSIKIEGEIRYVLKENAKYFPNNGTN